MATTKKQTSKTQASTEPQFVQPSQIEEYFDNKGKREYDEYGWTGHYSLSAKDIIDMLIDFGIDKRC